MINIATSIMTLVMSYLLLYYRYQKFSILYTFNTLMNVRVP